MATFRSKPLLVEATQFFRAVHFDGKHVTLEGVEMMMRGGEREFFIRSHNGAKIVCEGDWVITDALGELDVCKPDVFAIAYEPA